MPQLYLIIDTSHSMADYALCIYRHSIRSKHRSSAAHNFLQPALNWSLCWPGLCFPRGNSHAASRKGKIFLGKCFRPNCKADLYQLHFVQGGLEEFQTKNLSKWPGQTPFPQARPGIYNSSKLGNASPFHTCPICIAKLDLLHLSTLGQVRGVPGQGGDPRSLWRTPSGVDSFFDLLHHALLVRSTVVTTLNLVKHRTQVAECDISNSLLSICTVSQFGPHKRIDIDV